MKNPTLQLYHIKWEVEVEANSPEEAAMLSLDMQMDQLGVATIFVVDEKHRIDLQGYKSIKVTGSYNKCSTLFRTIETH